MKKTNSQYYLSMIAIVAVVAIIGLVVGIGPGSSTADARGNYDGKSTIPQQDVAGHGQQALVGQAAMLTIPDQSYQAPSTHERTEKMSSTREPKAFEGIAPINPRSGCQISGCFEATLKSAVIVIDCESWLERK